MQLEIENLRGDDGDHRTSLLDGIKSISFAWEWREERSLGSRSKEELCMPPENDDNKSNSNNSNINQVFLKTCSVPGIVISTIY